MSEKTIYAKIVQYINKDGNTENFFLFPNEGYLNASNGIWLYQIRPTIKEIVCTFNIYKKQINLKK